MRKMLKTTAILLIMVLILPYSASAATFSDQFDAKSVILMEASTGKVLYEFNADEALPPASVTKIMTILLIIEAIDKGKISTTDQVTVSAYASSMGGSQVYLKENEVMTVNDLLKAVVVSSANDAAVALAEYLCGSEASFVAMMNERAGQLGMVNTVFKNTNGLDDSDEGHLTSARDIGIMSRELLKHEIIYNYSTIWMDTIRDGAFGLTNTNRLIRFYNGANGLKTGSTSKAGFCISATANRGGMELIAVIMASSTRDNRNALATSLLDFGFSNYALTNFDGKTIDDIPLLGGVNSTCTLTYPTYSVVTDKAESGNVTQKVEIKEKIAAPVKKGEVLGKVTYFCGEEQVGSTNICAAEDVPKISLWEILKRLTSYSSFAS